jgi:hypothetical protein
MTTLFHKYFAFFVFFSLLFCAPARAQLTTDQKLTDFKTMAAQFAKRYVAPLWKQTVYGVDMWNIQPFLDRVAASTNDLDFYDICIDYVSQFHDGGHVFFAVPSDFVASTGISVDTYDGKPLIYAIDRILLPASRFPFQIGDEIISIDGVGAGDLMTSLTKYGILSNPRTAAGYAASLLTSRSQSVYPYAVNVPDTSQIVIRGQDATDRTYTIPWVKSGVPLTSEGPVRSPNSDSSKARTTQYRFHVSAEDAGEPAPPGPLYSEIRPELAVTGVGALRPVFTFPPSFKLRLGGNPGTDAYYSGTYPVGPYTIGFLRIPNFSPSIGVPAALAQFSSEIAYFNANTDGLIIDDMRNPGGLVYYGEELIRRLIPKPFHYIGFELRSTAEWVRGFDSYSLFLTAIRAPQYYQDFYAAMLKDVLTAFAEGGHTGAMPIDIVAMNPLPLAAGLDQVPFLDSKTGIPVGYTKPMMVLTDEFSFSGADYFAGTMQDNRAATIFGYRTGGLGGTNASYNAGAYSESVIGMLRGFMVRSTTVSVAGFPATNYIENVGVQPDIVDDYKTKDNLLHGGATFINDFTGAMVTLIQQSKGPS